MSILLHHFKELTECITEVERIEAKVNKVVVASIDGASEKGRRRRNTY